MAHDDNELKAALKAYDDAVEKYIPVLTSQAKIYWDMENYPQVEKVFKSSIDFASEHEIWKLNVAHTFFMQDRFHDAIKYYEPIVKKYQDNV